MSRTWLLVHRAYLPVLLLSLLSTGAFSQAADPQAGPAARLTQTDLARQAAHRPTFHPRELLVRYRGGVFFDAQDAASVESENGLSPIRFNSSLGIHRYGLPDSLSVAEALRRLRNDARIEFAEPNFVYYHHAVPNDGFYDNYGGVGTDLQKWYFDGIGGDRNLNAEAAWDVTTGRGDVVVAIIDSGIEQDHPDLVGNLWTNPGEIAGNGVDDDGNGFVDDTAGWDFYWNDNNPNPDYGDGFDNDFNGAADDGTFHGTFCASCVGATGNDGLGMTGAAWDCQLMAVKIFTDDGGAFVSDISDGITYAADNGADVISMSFGGGFSSSVQTAVNYAHAAGAVQVASAGNGNSSSAQYPSALNHVISVGASDSGSVYAGGSGDIDGRAWFSQYGTNAVDVVAPGVDIVGAGVGTVAGGNPGEDYWTLSQGTSFSCPLVAGEAALILSRSRDVGAGLDNDDVEAIIQNHTVNLPDDPNDSPNGGSSWDSLGRVDFAAAISAVQGGGPTNNPPVADAGPDQGGLTGQVLAFDGSGSFDPDSDPIVSYDWDFGDGTQDSGVSVMHSYGSPGVYTVTLTVSDGALTDDDTATVTVSDPSSGTDIYLVSVGNQSIPGLGTMRNEDVFIYDTGSGGYSWFLDGSDLGLASAAIDGLCLLPDGDVLFSLTGSFSIPGLVGGPGGSTTADDSDIIRFTPSSTGSNTSGVLTFHFDGSDVGLSSNGEDIDAISLDDNGNLVISTTGSMNANGLSGGRDEDLATFSASSLGASTSGSFSRLFDGSDVGLGGSGSDDVNAAHVGTGAAEIFLSCVGSFSASGLSGQDEDVFSFFPTSLGNSTSGSFADFFVGLAAGLPSSADINGVHVDE